MSSETPYIHCTVGLSVLLSTVGCVLSWYWDVLYTSVVPRIETIRIGTSYGGPSGGANYATAGIFLICR